MFFYQNSDFTDTMTATTFETGLVNALHPMRFHAFATPLYQFFETGLFTYLKAKPCTSVANVSADLEMDIWRLEAFVLYLRNESYLELDENSRVSLTENSID